MSEDVQGWNDQVELTIVRADGTVQVKQRYSEEEKRQIETRLVEEVLRWIHTKQMMV